jgi:hypothetical protein
MATALLRHKNSLHRLSGSANQCIASVVGNDGDTARGESLEDAMSVAFDV